MKCFSQSLPNAFGQHHAVQTILVHIQPHAPFIAALPSHNVFQLNLSIYYVRSERSLPTVPALH